MHKQKMMVSTSACLRSIFKNLHTSDFRICFCSVLCTLKHETTSCRQKEACATLPQHSTTMRAQIHHMGSCKWGERYQTDQQAWPLQKSCDFNLLWSTKQIKAENFVCFQQWLLTYIGFSQRERRNNWIKETQPRLSATVALLWIFIAHAHGMPCFVWQIRHFDFSHCFRWTVYDICWSLTFRSSLGWTLCW